MKQSTIEYIIFPPITLKLSRDKFFALFQSRKALTFFIVTYNLKVQKDNESDKAMYRNASLGAKSIIFFALSISLVVYLYT